MPSTRKPAPKQGGDGGGRHQETAQAASQATSTTLKGIHPEDRELFALAGIDYSDVPDLPIEQQGNGASSSRATAKSGKIRTITFNEDEPDSFQASISDPTGIKLTMPFLRAQARKGTPNQAAAADKAVTGLPLFVYGSKLFPEVLAQQLGLPKAAAMRLANNYFPAALPYCTRYCVAGDVPLAAVMRNHDEAMGQYLIKPYKETHVRGALVMGINEQYKHLLDAAYGANFKDEGTQVRWGVYKRVSVGVRVQLVGWDRPGWVMADTYVWNKSMARLRCFQDDLRWTPHLFVSYCQKKREEAAAKGVAYTGPPLWTPEDEAAWTREQLRLREAHQNRIAFQRNRGMALAESYRRSQTGTANKRRKVTKEELKDQNIISIDSDSSEPEHEDNNKNNNNQTVVATKADDHRPRALGTRERVRKIVEDTKMSDQERATWFQKLDDADTDEGLRLWKADFFKAFPDFLPN
ncbi:hypothetical protein IWX90DRAFT_487122 [Phyllosticta citrichinensis]|uniref:Uncharacterized protein n=1 Tax=Phyllosticta citrichinensis TaxID=1130410 RepID=A0ABR1XQC8_9PEZI